jgi:hypothetical protein
MYCCGWFNYCKKRVVEEKKPPSPTHSLKEYFGKGAFSYPT